MKIKINWFIWFASVFWVFSETAYLGWNVTGHSPQELMCAVIGLVLLYLSVRRS